MNQEIGENIINKSYSLQNQLLPKKLLKEYKKESFELINKIKKTIMKLQINLVIKALKYLYVILKVKIIQILFYYH